MYKFEYLSPSAIRELPSYKFVCDFLIKTGRTQIGWHYVIDLVWMHHVLHALPSGAKILDAGGGVGPIQFLLAELGFNVINVDLYFQKPARSLMQRYSLKYETNKDYEKTEYFTHLHNLDLNNKKSMLNSSMDFLRDIRYSCRHEMWARRNSIMSERGSITWQASNLCDLSGIADDTFDAVTSLSSLEHIPFDQLDKAANEIRRVAKKEALWAVTTSASCNEASNYHEPSQSHCFSDAELCEIFHCTTGKGSKEEVLAEYKNDYELKRNIAKFYKTSGNNGMPWGVWDPQYIPVGISVL